MSTRLLIQAGINRISLVLFCLCAFAPLSEASAQTVTVYWPLTNIVQSAATNVQQFYIQPLCPSFENTNAIIVPNSVMFNRANNPGMITNPILQTNLLAGWAYSVHITGYGFNPFYITNDFPSTLAGSTVNGANWQAVNIGTCPFLPAWLSTIVSNVVFNFNVPGFTNAYPTNVPGVFPVGLNIWVNTNYDQYGAANTAVSNALAVGTNAFDPLGAAAQAFLASSNFTATIGSNGTNNNTITSNVLQSFTVAVSNLVLAVSNNVVLATNGLGLPSGLSAFVPTNRFDTNLAGVQAFTASSNYANSVFQSSTNFALTLGQQGTNFTLVIGLNGTNGVSATSNVLQQFSLAISNLILAVSNNVVLATNGLGLPSGLAAFVSTNRWDTNNAGVQAFIAASNMVITATNSGFNPNVVTNTQASVSFGTLLLPPWQWLVTPDGTLALTNTRSGLPFTVNTNVSGVLAVVGMTNETLIVSNLNTAGIVSVPSVLGVNIVSNVNGAGTTFHVVASTWTFDTGIQSLNNVGFIGNGGSLTNIGGNNSQFLPTFSTSFATGFTNVILNTGSNVFVLNQSGSATNLDAFTNLNFAKLPAFTQDTNWVVVLGAGVGQGLYQYVAAGNYFTNVFFTNLAVATTGGNSLILTNAVTTLYSKSGGPIGGGWSAVSGPTPAPVTYSGVDVQGLIFVNSFWSTNLNYQLTNLAAAYSALNTNFTLLVGLQETNGVSATSNILQTFTVAVSNLVTAVSNNVVLATNGIGLSSALSAFVPTNRFDTNLAGVQAFTSASNYATGVFQSSTNFALMIGLNGTNGVSATSNVLQQFSLAISNLVLAVSNNVVLATNGIGLPSALSAFVPTNRFDTNLAGQQAFLASSNFTMIVSNQVAQIVSGGGAVNAYYTNAPNAISGFTNPISGILVSNATAIGFLTSTAIGTNNQAGVQIGVFPGTSSHIIIGSTNNGIGANTQGPGYDSGQLDAGVGIFGGNWNYIWDNSSEHMNAEYIYGGWSNFIFTANFGVNPPMTNNVILGSAFSTIFLSSSGSRVMSISHNQIYGSVGSSITNAPSVGTAANWNMILHGSNTFVFSPSTVLNGALAIGRNIMLSNNDSTVISDGSANVNSVTNNQLLLQFANGVGINTNSAGGSTVNVFGALNANTLAFQNQEQAGGNPYQTIGIAVLGVTNFTGNLASANGSYLQISSTLWYDTNSPNLGYVATILTNGASCLIQSNGVTVATAGASINGTYTISAPGSGNAPGVYIGSVVNETGVYHIGQGVFQSVRATNGGYADGSGVMPTSTNVDTIQNMEAYVGSNSIGNASSLGGVSALALNSGFGTSWMTNPFDFWLSADLIGTNDGSTLKQWTDRNGNAFIPFGSVSPVYTAHGALGFPAVYFSGGGMTNATVWQNSMSNNCTLFIVYRVPRWPAVPGVIPQVFSVNPGLANDGFNIRYPLITGSDSQLYTIWQSSFFYVGANAWQNADQSYGDDMHVFACTWNSSYYADFLDGKLMNYSIVGIYNGAAVSGPYPNVFGTTYLGTDASNTRSAQNLYLSEVLAYTNSESFPTIDQTCNYFLSKYSKLNRVTVGIFGDSLPKGGRATYGGTLQDFISAAMPGMTVNTIAFGGATSSQITSNVLNVAGTSSAQGKKIAFVWCSLINDAGVSVVSNSTTMFNDLGAITNRMFQCGQALETNGWYPVLVIPPSLQWGDTNGIRFYFESMMTNNYQIGFSNICNLSLDPNFGQYTQWINTAWFPGSDVHLSNAGYAECAKSFFVPIINAWLNNNYTMNSTTAPPPTAGPWTAIDPNANGKFFVASNAFPVWQAH